MKEVTLEELELAHACRKALLRGACLSVILLVPFTAVAALVEFRHESVVASAVAAVAFGLVTGPSTIVELLLAKRPRSLRQELLVALSTTILAGLALVAAGFQTIFTTELLTRGSVARALSETQEVLARLCDRGSLPGVALLAVVLTFPFVSVSVGRLRRRSFGGELKAAAACGLLAGLPALTIFLAKDLVDGWPATPWFLVPALVNVTAVLFLSGASRLADRVDAWIVARLAPS